MQIPTLLAKTLILIAHLVIPHIPKGKIVEKKITVLFHLCYDIAVICATATTPQRNKLFSIPESLSGRNQDHLISRMRPSSYNTLHKLIGARIVDPLRS